jgi:hypothetical protein
MFQEMWATPAYQKLRDDYISLDKELQGLVETFNSKRDTPDVTHGYVWLFRQK